MKACTWRNEEETYQGDEQLSMLDQDQGKHRVG